jgi:hypothetical protein
MMPFFRQAAERVLERVSFPAIFSCLGHYRRKGMLRHIFIHCGTSLIAKHAPLAWHLIIRMELNNFS